MKSYPAMYSSKKPIFLKGERNKDFYIRGAPSSQPLIDIEQIVIIAWTIGWHIGNHGGYRAERDKQTLTTVKLMKRYGCQIGEATWFIKVRRTCSAQGRSTG